MPDDHSKLAPLLPIPNRTVKRLRADDSADSRVKVGHRQALTAQCALQLVWVGGHIELAHLRHADVSSGLFNHLQFLEMIEKCDVYIKHTKVCYTSRLSWSQRSQAKREAQSFIGLPRILKNIQPISVGVWWRVPSSTELVLSTTNAHVNSKNWSFLQFLFTEQSRKTLNLFKIEL